MRSAALLVSTNSKNEKETFDNPHRKTRRLEESALIFFPVFPPEEPFGASSLLQKGPPRGMPSHPGRRGPRPSAATGTRWSPVTSGEGTGGWTRNRAGAWQKGLGQPRATGTPGEQGLGMVGPDTGNPWPKSFS